VQWSRKTFHPQPTTKYQKTHYLDLLKLMLEKGADPNVRLKKDLWYIEFNFSLENTNAAGTTPFWKCAAVADIDCMKLLVAHGADPNIPNVDNITPFLAAAGAGFHGNDEVTTSVGRLAAVKYLVDELKADVNTVDGRETPAPNQGQRGQRGQRPSTEPQAASQNQQTAQPGQQAQAPPPAQGQRSAQPGQQAAQNQQPAQPPQQMQGRQQYQGGFTALHAAAARGDNDMILYLVSKGAKIDAVSKNGSTVADMANGPRQRIQPFRDTIALLIALGAKNNHKCVSC
jgi:ankyrin repeat protein